MCKVFLYDNKLDLGIGQFASINGYKLVVDEKHPNTPEAVPACNGKLYGFIYDIDDNIIDNLNAYYGTGIGLHNLIEITATLAGGAELKVLMYEFNMEMV